MFSASIFIISLLPLLIFSLNLEKLFRGQISDAKCFSLCQAGRNEEDRSQCFVICKIIQENPSTDLCALSEVCLGGCQIACGDQQRNNNLRGATQFLNILLDKCKLSWEVQEGNTKVVILVAGKDQGNMWNLVHNNLAAEKVQLTPQLAAKFKEIQIFAINEKKVADKISLSLSEHQCLENVPEPREVSILPEEEPANISLSAIIVLSTVGTCSLLFIVSVAFFKSRPPTVFDPSQSYTEELSYATVGVSFSSSDVEACERLVTTNLTQENILQPIIVQPNISSDSSNVYEEIQIGELEYIEPFVF